MHSTKLDKNIFNVSFLQTKEIFLIYFALLNEIIRQLLIYVTFDNIIIIYFLFCYILL